MCHMKGRNREGQTSKREMKGTKGQRLAVSGGEERSTENKEEK